MKKLIVAFLAVITVASAAACASGGNKPSGTSGGTGSEGSRTTDGESVTTKLTDSLPEDLDFGGAKVVVHTRGDYNSVDEIFVEDTSNQVYEAIYKRNSVVEERLGVRIEVYRGAGWDTYYTTANSQLRASISSGDAAFDLVSGWQPCIPELATEGYMTDLNTVDFIGKTMPWWTQSLVDELTVAGKLYFVTGDISVFTMLGSMRVFVCNSTVAKDNGITGLYDTVRNGGWTLDFVTKLTKDLYRDNGNSQVDAGDTFGLLMGCANDVDAFIASARMNMSVKDGSGIPSLDMPVEKMSMLVDKVYDLMYGSQGTYVAPADAADTAFAMMQENRLLLAPFPVDTLRVAFGDLKSDFMVLPYPKLDENQKNYGTRIQDALQIWGIPTDINGEKLSAASAVLEALGYESRNSVTPVYFDNALKGRYTRDDESKAMMDLIKDSVFLSFEMIYNNYIGSPCYTLRNMLGAQSRDFMSYWSKREQLINEAFNTVIERLIEPGTEK